MPGPITQEYILRGTAQFDDIQNKTSQIQSFLNKLQLPTNLKASFTQTFNQLQSSAQKASNLIQQGFNTKGNITSFNKEVNNITASFDKLGKDMAKISPEMLEKSVPMLTEYKQKLNDISKQMQDVRSQMQQNVGQQWKDSIEGIVAEMSKLSGSGKIGDFAKEFKAGNLEEARNILNDITRTVGHFKDTTKTANFKAFTDQLYQGLSQAEQSSAGLQQRLGQLGQEYTNVAQQGVTELTQGLNQQDAALKNAKKDLESAADNTNKMADASVRAATDIDQFKNKLTYFFGLNNGIQLVRRAFTKLIQTMKELDEVMTQTAVVTDYTVSDMWSQLPEITARANELGVAIKGVYEADMLFYQQGLKTNQVMELSNESMKMARIAGLDAKTATDRMTNALRGFNMELDKTNAQRINDVYNALAARTASNVQEISSAMTKVASLANSANMSFENTAAFLAQIVETTRESAETAGTALKTVIARFSEVKKLVSEGELTGQTEEGEEIDVNKVSTALRAANIDLNEYLTGAKGLDQIFMELSSKWDSLDIVTQRYIATMAAGSRQQSRFIALMQDYSRMQELTGIATNANGAAQQQFEKTLESFETVVNRLKNAWNSFLLGLANNEVIKGAINLFTGLINTLSKLIDTLSFGSSWVKTFLTAFLAIGGFSIGKQITNKMFAGLGAAMRGEGLKAGAAFNSGYKVTIKSFSAAHQLETQKAIIADNSLKTSRERLIKVSTAVNKQGYSNISLRKLEAAASEEVTAQEEIRSKAEIDLINAQHAYAQSLGVTESQLEVYDAILKDTNNELVAAKVASTGLTYEQYQSVAATGAQNVATAKGVAVEKLSTEEKQKATLAELQKTKMKNMGVLASIKEAIATTLSTNKTKAETVAAWADVKAKMAQKMASFRLAGAILAAVAAVTILTIALINSGESATERYERLQKEFKLVSDGAKRLREETENLGDSLTSLEEHQKNLNSLVQYTTEWKDETAALNKEVKDLVDKFPELLKFATYDKNGNLVIDASKVREYQNKLENQSAKADVMEQVYKGVVAEAEAEAYYKDTVEAGTLGYGEGALTEGFNNTHKETTQAFAKWVAGGLKTQELVEILSQDTYTSGSGERSVIREGANLSEFTSNLEQARMTNPIAIWEVIDKYTHYYYDSDEESINAALAYGEKLLKAEEITPNRQLVDSAIANLRATQENYDETYNAAISNFLTGRAIPDTSIDLNDPEQYKEYNEMIREMFKSDEGEDRVQQVNFDGSIVFKDEYKEDSDLKDIKGTNLLEAYGISTLVDDWSAASLEFINTLNETGNENLKKLFSGEQVTRKEILGILGISEDATDKDIIERIHSGDEDIASVLVDYGLDIKEHGQIFIDALGVLSKALQNSKNFSFTTGDEDITKADESGVSKIYLDEKVEQYNDKIKSLNLNEQKSLDLAKKLSARYGTVHKAMLDLCDSYDKWNKLVQQDGSIKVITDEDEKVFKEYQQAFNDMFNIDSTEMGKLGVEFYTDAENVQLLTDALNGSDTAYYNLAKNIAAKQLDIQVGVNGEELTNEAQDALNYVNEFIQNYDFASLEPGQKIDDTKFINGLNTLIQEGAIAADQIQTLLGNFSASITINAESYRYKGKTYSKNQVAGFAAEAMRHGAVKSFDEYIQKFGYTPVIESVVSSDIPTSPGLKSNKSGSDKTNYNLSQIDEYTNTVRQIAALEQKISDIEAKRSNILAKHTGNAKKYTELVKQQLDYLEAQKAEMEWLQDKRLTQLTNFTDQAQNGADWKIAGKNAAGEEALISVKDYAQYISWDKASGKVEVNWAPYNASTDEIFKSNFDAVLSAMESVADEYLAQQQKILKAEEDQIKLIEESRGQYKTMEDKVVEMITWERQQEIDALTAINDNINNTQSEIMDSIQKQIDLERQIRDNTKKEDEISDIENQIAFLSRDTSGANDVRIKELQKSLDDMTEEYQDTLIDQELQRITDANEEAAKQRERQIDILTKSLEYDQERGLLAQQALELIFQAFNDNENLTRTDALYARMMEFFGKEGASVTAISEDMESFKDSFSQAGPYLTDSLLAMQGLEVTINAVIDKLKTEQEQITAFDDYVSNINTTFANEIATNDVETVKTEMQSKTAEIFGGVIPQNVQDIIDAIGQDITLTNLQDTMKTTTESLQTQNTALQAQMEGILSAAESGMLTSEQMVMLKRQMETLLTNVTAWGWNEQGSKALLDWAKGWNNAIDTGIINSKNSIAHMQGLWNELVDSLNNPVFTKEGVAENNDKVEQTTSTQTPSTPQKTPQQIAAEAIQIAWNKFGSTQAEQKAGTAIGSSWSKSLTGEQRLMFGAKTENESYNKYGAGATFDYFADGGRGQTLWLNDSQYIEYIYDWAKAYDQLFGTVYRENIGLFVENFYQKYGNNGAKGWAFLDYMRGKLLEIFSGNAVRFAAGGLATSIGPAWLDGTPNRPEYVLNPAQTEAFLQLPDLLRSLDLTAGQNVSYGDTSIEINIQVDQLASDYDVEQLAEKIKTEIYDDSAYRNVNSIGWIR